MEDYRINVLTTHCIKSGVKVSNFYNVTDIQQLQFIKDFDVNRSYFRIIKGCVHRLYGDTTHHEGEIIILEDSSVWPLTKDLEEASYSIF